MVIGKLLVGFRLLGRLSIKDINVLRLISLGLVLWFSSFAAFALEYTVEPCCNLCPEARNASNYESGSLRGMRFLVDGKDGWLFRTDDDFMETFGPSSRNRTELSHFIAMLKQQGTELSIVYIPTRGLVHSDQIYDLKSVNFDLVKAKSAYEAALAELRGAGAIVPDLAQIYNKPAASDYFFKRDHHWTPDGAQLSARLLADEIKKHAVYEQLPEMPFRSYPSGVLRRTGQLQVAARRICQFDYPFQFVPNYVTEPEAVDTEADASSALFGDDTMPAVTLVGTSNSWNNNNDFNFSGFLKDDLNVDVLNESIAGGNFDGSLLQYLMSAEFRDAPPKLLIWEMPSYYDLDDPMFYRRVRPMLAGGCDNREILLETQNSLKPGRNEILFNGSGEVKRLKSQELIMDLTFDNPEFRELRGYVWYIHGRREPIRMQVTDRVNIQGRFVFEVMPDAEWQDFIYMSTDIELPVLDDKNRASMPQNVTARLCRKDY